MPLALLGVALGLAALSVGCGASVAAAAREKRWLAAATRGLVGALFLALALLAATVGVAVRGYRAFTHEELAAVVQTEPLGPQRFRATVRLADGSLHMFDLAGDAMYVDARILKWHPWVNLLGLHTAYALDRIAGRYTDLAQERRRPRTVERLGPERAIDLFWLARRYWIFAPLVDAEYGSATFIEAAEPAAFEVRVSTTGLLVRRVPRAGPPPPLPPPGTPLP
ncbi:MAG: hypothetical protein ACREL9_07850 [Gemmatimonadales bacterium]